MKKLRCKRAVTLTEMLCVLLVLSLIGITLVTGTEFAMETFHKTVARSEANILCSTLAAAVKDELRYAGSMTLKGTDFSYFSPSSGDGTSLRVEDGIIRLVNAENTRKDLVSKSAYTYGAEAELAITYDEARNIFSVSIAVKNRDTVLAENTFEVQRLRTGDVWR